MKTLVIHPTDPSTEFLSAIYADKNWTVVKDCRLKDLKLSIKSHDRIIMLGHGSKYGLFGKNNVMIDNRLVYLLKDKINICIWCDADGFVKKYKLKSPLYTGMIISDIDEAAYLSVDINGIEESNNLLAKAIGTFIDTDTPILNIKEMYRGENEVFNYNTQRIYGD